MAILVNAAGITQHRLLIRTQPETIDAIIDTNLKGTILGCRAAAIAMIKSKKGCIINVSSLLGVRAGRGASAYAASKAGVLGQLMISSILLCVFLSIRWNTPSTARERNA